MSNPPPATRQDLTHVDVVLDQGHRYNAANVQCRQAIKDLLRNMDGAFFAKTIKQKAAVIADLQKVQWKYWEVSTTGPPIYQEAREKEIRRWLQQYVRAKAAEVQKLQSSSSSLNSSTGASLSTHDTVLQGTDAPLREAGQNSPELSVGDVMLQEMEASLQGIGQFVEETHISRPSRGYAKTKAGRAWLSLFSSSCDDLDDTDIEEILNQEPNAGDFSVVKSISEVQHRGSDQPLAKFVAIQADGSKKRVHWFYDMHDGRYYTANKANGAVSQPFDSLDKLIKKECRDSTIFRWHFKRHDQHENVLLRVMTQAAESASIVLLGRGDSSSSKRSRFSATLSDSEASSLTLDTHGLSIASISQDVVQEAVAHEEV